MPAFSKILIITTIDFSVVANHRVHALINYWAKHAKTLHILSCLYLKQPRFFKQIPSGPNLTHYIVPIFSLQELYSQEIIEARFVNLLHNDYDLIFTEGFWAGLIGSILKKEGMSRLIYEDLRYMPEFSPAKKDLIEELELQIMSQADLIFSTSKQLTFKRQSNGLPAIYSPNGIHQDVFSRFHLDEHPPTVVYSGVLNSFSGLEYLLRAWPEVLAEEKNARLIIIGTGSAGKKLIKLSKGLGVAKSVKFTGPLPHHRIPFWFNQADVGWAVFSPPDIAQYIFPLKFLEYLASGLLPIVGEKGDMADIVRRTGIGMAVSLNRKEIARAIIALLEKSSGYQPLKLRTSLSSFAWGNIFDYQKNIIHKWDDDCENIIY